MANLSGTFAADGNSATLGTDGSVGTVMVSGTWGGGTVQMHASPDSTNYFLITGAVLTENGSFNFALPQGMTIRLTLSGSTSPDLDYWVFN